VDQPGRESANEALAPGEIPFWHPLVQRPGIGKVLLDHRVEQSLVEIRRRALDLCFQHGPGQHVGGGHAVDTFLHEEVAGIAKPLAGLDEEINDFRERHVEQRRHLGTRMHHPVQGDPRRSERDSQVARTVHGVLALDQFAAQEERRGNHRVGRLQIGVHRVHDRPRT
jgi:hypothetical protein